MGQQEAVATTLAWSWRTLTAYVAMGLSMDAHVSFSMVARFRLMTLGLFGAGVIRHEPLAGRDWNESSKFMGLTFQPWSDGPRGVS